jgi:3-hydroxyacyl-[acyl-carrier-protein] dehydratase
VVLDINDIKKSLPHRYPFLLVDRIEEITCTDELKQITGIKNVTINEPFFQGHFPSEPVMPGVLILEAMGQVAGVLVTHSLGREADPDQVVYVVTIDNAKFRKPVKPGDQLRTVATLVRSRGNVGKFKFVATVDGEVVAEAVMGFAIAENEKK